MLASHPERAPKINAYKYFYVLGLLSGIGLTLLGLSIVATIKSDSFDANLSQGIAGLFLALMGLVPLQLMYTVRRHLSAGQREGLGWLSALWTSSSLLMLSLICGGMSLFSQKMLLLWLGNASFIPDIVSGLFLVGVFILLWLGVKRLASFHERMKQGQLESSQNLGHEE